MPHIHEKYDFTVTAIIVYGDTVLMVFHKKLKRWLFIGGHIELDEDVEEALYREVREECGLDIEVLGTKPVLSDASDRRKFLLTPAYLDVHPITDMHSHINFCYVARTYTNNVTLEADAHEAIKWFTPEELDDPQYRLDASIQFLAREGLRIVREASHP